MVYNVLSCSGFAEGTAGWMASGGCFQSRIGFVLLFFVLAIVRKWGAEEWGISFSFLISLVAGLLLYFILVTFTGSFKFSFGIGLIIGILGGYVGGLFFESEGGY